MSGRKTAYWFDFLIFTFYFLIGSLLIYLYSHIRISDSN
jgi:hypothetical protein